jgi:hypothetical protein
MKTTATGAIASSAASADGVSIAASTSTRRLTRSAVKERSRPALVLRPAIFDRQVIPFDVAAFLQCLSKFAQRFRESIRRLAVEKANDRTHVLLRMRRQRTRGCHAANKRDELAEPHSITSSASKRMEVGKSSPSDLAAFKLTTSSNLVDCITGSSASLAPLSMRPVYTPSCRLASVILVP